MALKALALTSNTGPQLRLAYDGTKYATFEVNAGGALNLTMSVGTTFALTGSATISGALTVGTEVVTSSVRRPDNTGALALSGGGSPLTASAGAYLFVGGASHATLPGLLILQAGDVTGGDILLMTANGVERGRFHRSGVVSIGNGTIATGASAGDFVLPFNGAVRAVNAAGTTTLGLLSLGTGNGTVIGLNGQRLLFASPATRTTVGSAGGASAMPTPVGYLDIEFPGVGAYSFAYFNRGA